MSQRTNEEAGSALSTLMGLAGFRCELCREPLGGDLYCRKCRIGHCPFCGDLAVGLNGFPGSGGRALCKEHIMGLDATTYRQVPRDTRVFLPRRSALDMDRMVLKSDLCEPPVFMDTEPFRTQGNSRKTRIFFGEYAPLLDALNPTGWAHRDVFAARLLAAGGANLHTLVFPPAAGRRGVRAYFAREKPAAEKALAAFVERFEERLEAWLSGRATGGDASSA